ncbi:MAG: FAD-dependent oxidoreductase [Burkholderiales bacterium]|nr:FAD-dependent oxidoreductase [Burkholderiales bacterium]
MEHRQYVIAGSGLAAFSAVVGIRSVDRTGSIAMFGSERHPPYDRPPLSKSLWKGEPLESIWKHADGLDFELHSGTKIVSIDPKNRVAVDDSGRGWSYDRLLLATGGSPRHLPFAEDGVLYLRTVDDYLQIRKACESEQEVVVIGGGFIGSEIAAALCMNGKKVTMIFPDKGIGARAYPADLSAFLNGYYREKGIRILSSDTVAALWKENGRYFVKTASGEEIAAGCVVAGIGITPESSLAEAAGLEVGNGILVDEFLRTKNHDIYAAGDVANFYSPCLSMRMRVEHEDNARVMGEIAGKNMAGEVKPYTHLPFFYSDLFDLGFEAIGILDSSLDIHSDWQEPYRKGVIRYSKEGKVRGVLLWNTWGQLEQAARLICEG